MSDTLTDAVHDWASDLLGFDTRQGADATPPAVQAAPDTSSTAEGPQAAPAAAPADKPPPDTPADPSKQSLYIKEAGDSTDVSENDIHQGQVGDCFVLSSVGEIAKLKPDVIKKSFLAVWCG
jgi:hypothetical protein